MEKPCDTCAGYTNRGIANYEEIVTCSKCRIAREHTYCMRDLSLFEDDWDPDKWVCDSCLAASRLPKVGTSSADRVHNDGAAHSPGPSRNHWQTPKSQKVKYLPAEEVKKLESGNLSQKTSFGQITVTQKSPVFGLEANISNIPSGIPKRPPRCVQYKSISKIIQEAPQVLNHSPEMKFRVASRKDHVGKKQPGDVETSYKKMEAASTNKRCTVSTPRHFSPLSRSETRVPRRSRKGDIVEQSMNASELFPRHSSLAKSYGGKTSAVHSQSHGEERELNKFPSVHLLHSYLPAPETIWEGIFAVPGADMPDIGIQAQPPCKVHKRTYEVSCKMPPVLGAILLPRLNVWADLFQDECPPDPQDVGLYFFPDDNNARSRESFDKLFQKMDSENSILSYVDNEEAIELLIFTSKQLHLSSLIVDAVTSPKKFLWGIFRDATGFQADMEMDATTVDMEVDMLGGEMVGTVDKVVPKDISTHSRTIHQPIMNGLQELDMEVDMLGGEIVGTVDVVFPRDISTPSRTLQQPTQPVMVALQQLLTMKNDIESSHQMKLTVLDSSIKRLMTCLPEERLTSLDISAASSSERKPFSPLPVKLEKHEEERPLSMPLFPEQSPSSGRGSSDGRATPLKIDYGDNGSS